MQGEPRRLVCGRARGRSRVCVGPSRLEPQSQHPENLPSRGPPQAELVAAGLPAAGPPSSSQPCHLLPLLLAHISCWVSGSSAPTMTPHTCTPWLFLLSPPRPGPPAEAFMGISCTTNGSPWGSGTLTQLGGLTCQGQVPTYQRPLIAQLGVHRAAAAAPGVREVTRGVQLWGALGGRGGCCAQDEWGQQATAALQVPIGGHSQRAQLHLYGGREPVSLQDSGPLQSPPTTRTPVG